MIDKNVKPNFKIVEIDETEHWSKDIKARGQVFSVYLVDTNQHVHVCSTEPSYELHFLYLNCVAKDEDDRDSFYDEVERADTSRESVEYVSTGTKFKNSVDCVDSSALKEFENGELSYDELVEALSEHYSGDHVI